MYASYHILSIMCALAHHNSRSFLRIYIYVNMPQNRILEEGPKSNGFTFAKLCLGGDKQRLGLCQAGDLRCPSEGLGRLVDAGDIFQGFLVGFFRRRYIYILINQLIN